MKTLPTLLAADYARTAHTIAAGLKITLLSGSVLAFSSLNHDVVVGSDTLVPGFDLSAIASTATLSVDNMTLTVTPDEAVILSDDLRKGRWRSAAFEVFEFNYLAPGNGVNPLKIGTIGEATANLNKFAVEFRGAQQPLQQQQGTPLSKTCLNRLGDARCLVDLTSFTKTGTVEWTDDSHRPGSYFGDSSRTEADDYFTEGIVTMLTGNNAGFSQKVRSSRGDAEDFFLSLAFPNLIVVGDTYRAIAGCRKRHDRNLDNLTGVSDCLDKFNNVLNMRASPVGVTLDDATKPGSAA